MYTVEDGEVFVASRFPSWVKPVMFTKLEAWSIR
jgi:hypothetical protein